MKSSVIVVSLGFLLTLPSTAFASIDPIIGTTAIVGKGADGAVCAATRDKLKAAYGANAIHDSDGVAEALQAGTLLVRGERILVLDNAVGSGFMQGIDVRVRILSGPDAHLACWAWQNTMHLQPER
jgi:hypothetical protein